MISIVFITCDRLEELKIAIFSCLDKIDEKFEIIVINNSENSDINDDLTKFAQLYQFKLVYINNKRNIGVAPARNQGYKWATGDIVYFLDDDASIISPGKCISDVASFMRSNLKHAIIANEIYHMPLEIYQHGPFLSDNNNRSNGEVLYFVGASHFINKATLGLIELYPEQFFYGGEEYYLSFYLQTIGLSVYYYKDMFVNHVPSSSARLSNDEMMVNNYSNGFNVKRYFTPWIFLPFIWAVMCTRAFFQIIKKPSLFTLFVKKIKLSYNSKYRAPLSIDSYILLIQKYGFRVVL